MKTALVFLEVLALFFCASATADELDVLNTDFPVVLTPTRLRQSLPDVPASVTIITAEMIRNYAIRTVPDALRLVPGMAVTQVAGNDYRINYHGTNIVAPRRMNVLVDGVSVYRPAFARVGWKELPISVHDIERIEVTRGPASVAYGANSMLAVVNIISKHPGEDRGVTGIVTVGTDRSDTEMLRYSGQLDASTTYRLTLEHGADKGFDYLNNMEPNHDSTSLNKLSFNSLTELGPDETLALQAWLVQGKEQVQYVDAYQLTFPDISTQDYYLNGTWKKLLAANHEVQVQGYYTHHKNDQEWRTCPPTALFLPEMFAMWQANQSYARSIIAGKFPSGGTPQDNALAVKALTAIAKLGPTALKPNCVTANQNLTETRADIEFQDTYVFSNELRMVNGFGYRNDTGKSQTFVGGKVTNETWRVFSNFEYKPIDPVSINLGGYYETDTLTGSFFSPRAALNYHLNENNTLRFVASLASRMPDIKEQRANWTYFATNFSQPLNGATEGYFFQSAIAPGNVNAERNFSKEIGLLSNFPRYGLLLDARVFEDSLSDLISEKLQLSSFFPTNTNHATLRGAEFQASYSPNDRWSMNLGYAYLENRASTSIEKTHHAQNSGSFAITRRFDHDWRASFTYSAFGSHTEKQTPYGSASFVLMKSFRLSPKSSMITALTISRLNDLTTSYSIVGTDQTREAIYKDPVQGYLTVQITY